MKIIIAVCLSLIFTGCLTESKVEQSEIDKVDKEQAPPSKKITRYSEALLDFSEMLDAYNVPALNIQTKAITNATSSMKVPADIQQMIKTAINSIGGKVTYVEFDSNRLLTEQALGKKINLELVEPDIIISGAITEYDKDLVKKGKKLNADYLTTHNAQELDIGGEADAESAGARLAIDLQIENYQTKRLAQGVQSQNAITIFKTSNTKEMGVAFAGSGLGFKCSVDTKQGLHSSMRLLVELSIIEILGEYYDVPYWRCIPDGVADKRMKRKYRRAIESDENIAIKLKILAYGHGKNIDLSTMNFTQRDIQSFNELKKEYNILDEHDLYIALWENLPIAASAKRLRSFNRNWKRNNKIKDDYIEEEVVETENIKPIKETPPEIKKESFKTKTEDVNNTETNDTW